MDITKRPAARAIVMRRTGPPDVLSVEEVDLPPLRPGEVQLRMLSTAINHSDLEIRAGNWPILKTPPFPYVPGLEMMGEVTRVADDVLTWLPGDRAWTMMQGLGGVRAERDGGHADYVTVPASTLAPLPENVDPVAWMAFGLVGVTALEGIRRLGPMTGKNLLVSGVTGGVGAAALQIGKALGANVVALDRNSPPPPPNSVDGVLDGVAGPHFPALVAALRPGGRYCLVGAAAGGDVNFDVWSLLDGRTLTGFSTEDLDGEGLRKATRELLIMELNPPPYTVFSLAEVPHAHHLMESRLIKGRVIIVPG